MSSELSSPLTEGTRYSYAPNQVQFIAQDYLKHFGSERSRELADTMCDSDRSIAKTIVFTPVLALRVVSSWKEHWPCIQISETARRLQYYSTSMLQWLLGLMA